MSDSFEIEMYIMKPVFILFHMASLLDQLFTFFIFPTDLKSQFYHSLNFQMDEFLDF